MLMSQFKLAMIVIMLTQFSNSQLLKKIKNNQYADNMEDFLAEEEKQKQNKPKNSSLKTILNQNQNDYEFDDVIQYQSRPFYLSEAYQQLVSLEDQYQVIATTLYQSIHSFVELNQMEINFYEDYANKIDYIIEDFEKIYNKKLRELENEKFSYQNSLKQNVIPYIQSLEKIIADKDKIEIRSKKDYERLESQFQEQNKEMEKRLEQLQNIVKQISNCIETKNEQLIYSTLETIESQMIVGLFKNNKKYDLVKDFKTKLENMISQQSFKKNESDILVIISIIQSYLKDLIFNLKQQVIENYITYFNNYKYIETDISTQIKGKKIYQEYYELVLIRKKDLSNYIDQMEYQISELKKIINRINNYNKQFHESLSKQKFHLKDEKKHFYQLAKSPRKINGY